MAKTWANPCRYEFHDTKSQPELNQAEPQHGLRNRNHTVRPDKPNHDWAPQNVSFEPRSAFPAAMCLTSPFGCGQPYNWT